jgi:nitroimidazol reductase NimA-like FMN-containing flavoprotein (pyridoxamine 5'-phosphate oxidase superfamily)
MTVNPADRATVEARPGSPRWPAPSDPGDLSRRLAARRAELRLSCAQVARRARMNPRYLEYLESFPAQPRADTLRRLAAALSTTPAALLGAGVDTPPGRRPGPVGQLEPLSRAECRRLLAPGGLGRIAIATASGLMVLPVNYALVAGTIVVRTGAGSLIAAHGDDPVSFETDHLDETLRRGWSVLVRGQAHRVLQPAELRNLREACDLRPWPAGEHDLYVRIVPIRITGRRLQPTGT